MAPLRVALFVEGGEDVPPARRALPLTRIWEHLVGALGLRAIDVVIPISKKHLVAMNPDNPVMSGAGEALDQLMVRRLDEFDVAVVAWDLVPAWNAGSKECCRWTETCQLYDLLGRSAHLPAPWRDKARARHAELTARTTPSARAKLPAIEPGAVLALCMEPMFEGLLVQDEAAVRRALGVTGKNLRKWPRRGWGDPDERKPDRAVLAPAIAALKRVRPKPSVLRQIPANMRTHKNDWGEYLLRALLADPDAAPLIRRHPLAARLADILRP